MTGPPDAHKERSPDLGQEIRASGIEALPGRVERYGQAKSRALDNADYLRSVVKRESLAGTRPPRVCERQQEVAVRVATCGDWLLFAHYLTIDEVRLQAAKLCCKHLLCPLCAIRRGAKALKAYLDRYEVIRALKPGLRPFLVTLTVKDGSDLAERFKHLHVSQRELWKRRQRRRGSQLDQVEGAVWSYEVKRGSGSGLWHPHLHMVALAIEQPNQVELAREWQDITGDSFIVDVRPIEQADLAAGFLEVFKYALKFSDMEPADTVAAYEVLARRRLIGSAGVFRGVDVPQVLTDEPFDELPAVELLYQHIRRMGYRLVSRKERPVVGRKSGTPQALHAVGAP
jgi:hypothetical protein